MSEWLKPCPFCGRNDVHFASHPTNDRWGVVCNNCDVWRDDRCATKDEAATIWNTRADLSDALLREADEALIGALSGLVAAISLLERGGKKAAASDKMFDQMLKDYNASADKARATLAKLRRHLGEMK